MERERASALPALLVAVGLLSTLVLYVTSVGPVVLAYERLGHPAGVEHFIDTFYAPLDWAHNHTPAREPLRWYVELWIGP